MTTINQMFKSIQGIPMADLKNKISNKIREKYPDIIHFNIFISHDLKTVSIDELNSQQLREVLNELKI